MCDFTKGLKLCNCAPETIKFREPEVYKRSGKELIPVKNKKNDAIPLRYIWQLFRFVGTYDNFAMPGHYILPTDPIGKGLDAEWIALRLNCENCFDFDYIPQEGNSLFIQQNVVLGPYISFVFKDGLSSIDHFSPFDVEIKQVNKGMMQPVS